jgi:hypothetical protein
MKKLILIAGLTILTSCKNESNEKGILDSIISSNDTPKCDDEDVKNTVLSILKENSQSLITNSGRSGILISKHPKIINIMTKSKDDDLKLCGCEGAFIDLYKGNVIYTAQKNSAGEVIVNLEDAGTFELNMDFKEE